MDSNTLIKLQQVETDMLAYFDSFCRKHNLKYSLYAGTALGAVRHKGFIPWDDDIDLCMERNEYEKLISLWKNEENKGYYLQNPESDESRINHIKIRKDNTILASYNEMNNEGHHGIWIDIFPIDKVPMKKMPRKLFILIAKIRLVYTRGYAIKGKGKALEFLSKIMLIIPRSLQIKIRKKCDKYVKKYRNREKDYCLYSLSSPEALKVPFLNDMLNNTRYFTFGKYEFLMTDKYDDMLTRSFGNYMELPPVEERICKHNPEILSFGEDD